VVRGAPPTTVAGDPHWSATAAGRPRRRRRPRGRAGPRAYHHDGTRLLQPPERSCPATRRSPTSTTTACPRCSSPTTDGLSLLEHDGTIKYQNLRPTGDPVAHVAGFARPPSTTSTATARPEYATSARPTTTRCTSRRVDRVEANVQTTSRHRGGTAFDFLGDGIAEAMYADEHNALRVRRRRQPLLQVPAQQRHRSSSTRWSPTSTTTAPPRSSSSPTPTGFQPRPRPPCR
jgi:hypothetical protein